MVSVIIPTYNRIATIARAVDSVLGQTYRDIELIIADDGSSDGTCESLATYGDKVRIVKQPNSGPSAARNLGARAARGEILSFLDSDDSWLPDKIERQVEVLEKSGPDVPCCICNAALDNEPGRASTSFAAAGIPCDVESGFILNPAQLLATRFLLFNQVVAVRRPVFEKIGGFNEDLWVLEDHEIALRLSIEGRWGFVSSPLVEKFESEGNLGGAARKDHIGHLAAVDKVLTLFLNEHPGLDPDLRKAVERERRGIREAIQGSKLAGNPSLARSAAGRAWLFAQRVRRAVQRRSSDWPRPQIVPLAGPVTGPSR